MYLSTHDIISLVFSFISLVLVIISIIFVIITLRQNHKMIESSTRPYLNIYGNVTYSDERTFYLVLKNFGSSSAIINNITASDNLETFSFSKKNLPFLGYKNTTIPPGKRIIWALNTTEFDESEIIKFNIEYTSSKITYNDTCLIHPYIEMQNAYSGTRDSSNYLKDIYHTLSDYLKMQL